MPKEEYGIAADRQKIVFKKQNGVFGFQLWLRLKDEWRPVSRPDNPLLAGPSFNLRAQKIEALRGDTLSLQGKGKGKGMAGKTINYSFQSTIKLLDNGWFKIELELNLPASLRLDQSVGEPQILFQLPTIPVQQEGSFIWQQLLLPNPVTDTAGIQSTDLPAAYYFDPQLETEFLFYLDWESFNWASPKNIFGFLGGRCGLKSLLKPGPDQPVRERFFGFWPENNTYLGTVFPQGKQRFRYFLRLHHLDHSPSEWKGLSCLIQSLAPLLKSQGDPRRRQYSWVKFARLCWQDLVKTSASQIQFDNRGLGFRAYQKIGNFHSGNPPGRVELMTQVDLVWPLYFYSQLQANLDSKQLFEKLFRLLPYFFDQEAQFLGNWYPQPRGELLPQDIESWYFLENGLVKFGWIAALTGDPQLKRLFLDFVGQMRKLAHECYYLFPLRYDWRKKRSVGAKKNFVAGGLYSYGMWLAYKITKEKAYLDETERALQIIRQLPIDLLFHEPQQLGFGAAAAFCLAQETGKEHYHEWAWELLAQQLRMFYWYTDLGLLESIGCDCAGMVRSFPSKIYPVVKHNPAFKENIESVLPWTIILAEKKLTQPLLKFLNLVRRNNFYFFDSSQGFKGPQSAIPLESLPALPESGKRHQGGGVGHAIYGAGEVFWLSLLFESQAIASHPDILVICLDYLNWEKAINFGKEQNFLVYNPTARKEKFDVHFKNPPHPKVVIDIEGEIRKLSREAAQKGVALTLSSQGYLYVRMS